MLKKIQHDDLVKIATKLKPKSKRFKWISIPFLSE